jgi:hypothetical protein
VPVSAVEAPQREGILTPLALSRLLEWLDEGVDSNGERYLEMHRDSALRRRNGSRPTSWQTALRRIARTQNNRA